jgi:hypothetical protein
MPAAVDLVAATPEQAANAAALLNKGREVDDLPEMIQELSNREQVAILSVGPWAQVIKAGTLGTKYVPACKDGEEYSDPLVLDGLTVERYPLREGKMDLLMHKNATGWNTAMQLIGVGAHLHPMNSKVKYGLFVTKGNPGFPPLSAKDANDPEKKRWWLRERFKPTKEELEKARKALYGRFNSLVQEARSAAAQGQKALEETVRPTQHILAAQRLGLDPQTERWMQNAVPEAARVKCGYCGVSVPDGVIKCPNCKEILNQEAYDRMKAGNKKKGD